MSPDDVKAQEVARAKGNTLALVTDAVMRHNIEGLYDSMISLYLTASKAESMGYTDLAASSRKSAVNTQFDLDFMLTSNGYFSAT
jgi:hypothetical protein